jgi:hypothetical protein
MKDRDGSECKCPDQCGSSIVRKSDGMAEGSDKMKDRPSVTFDHLTAELPLDAKGAVATLAVEYCRVDTIPLDDAGTADLLGITLEQWRLMSADVIRVFNQLLPVLPRRPGRRRKS